MMSSETRQAILGVCPLVVCDGMSHICDAPHHALRHVSCVYMYTYVYLYMCPLMLWQVGDTYHIYVICHACVCHANVMLWQAGDWGEDHGTPPIVTDKSVRIEEETGQKLKFLTPGSTQKFERKKHTLEIRGLRKYCSQIGLFFKLLNVLYSNKGI